MRSKIMGLREAVSEIPNGAEIALGGFAITRNPIAFTNELIRQGKKNLTIYEIIGSMDSDMLVGAGAVRRFSYGGGSLDRFGKIGRINEAIEKGLVDVREYSGLSISFRFLAGSLGIPYIPTKTLLGTDIIQKLIEKDDSVMIGSSPYNGDKLVFVKALQPEYAVLHAPCADEKGNVIIEGPVWDKEIGLAAKKLYVTVDKIVSNDFIKRNPEKVAIPSIYTHAVIEVPYGAYPTSVYKQYDYDAEMLTRYAGINKTQEEFDVFLRDCVLNTKNHNEFLEKCGGMARLLQLRADPVFGYCKN
jgi:acyl CoA:acetate/3-ketoacid CoA transferase alpha subunit